MAVDTAAKRYAMINFSAGDLLYPPPDGSVTAPDRLSFIGLYDETGGGGGGGSTTGQLMMMGLGG